MAARPRGAQVLLTGPVGPYDSATIADAAGRFHYVLRRGRVGERAIVLATAPGCALAWVSLFPDQEATIRLGSKPAALTGRATDPAGRGIGGAHIQVTALGAATKPDCPRLSGYPPLLTATSDADGKFTIPGFPRGLPLAYRVCTLGYADMEGTATAGWRKLRLSLAPEAVLEGRVLLDGQPVPGVCVSSCHRVERRVSRLERNATAGADGAYRLDRLAAGEISVTVPGADLRGAVGPLGPQVFKVKAGDHLTGCDILLTRIRKGPRGANWQVGG